MHTSETPHIIFVLHYAISQFGKEKKKGLLACPPPTDRVLSPNRKMFLKSKKFSRLFLKSKKFLKVFLTDRPRFRPTENVFLSFPNRPTNILCEKL